MKSETTVSIVLPHSADDTWSAISDFGDYRWGEGVGAASVEGRADQAGAIRRFSYYGSPSEQRLTAYGAARRMMSWESVAPYDATLSHYAASIRVLPVTISDQSFVEWSVEFDAAADAVDRWRAHQRREFRKSLERLSLWVDWAKRAEVD